MEQVIEKEISLPKVSVLLANVRWGAVQEFNPLVPGYYICQRLSGDHSALRIDNRAVRQAFPYVQSVGLLPPAFSVRVFPVETRFRGLNCVFDKEFFESTTEIDPARWNQDNNAFLSIPNKRLEKMMQHIHSELFRPTFGTDLVIESASTMMLVELARYAKRGLEKSSAEDGSFRGGLASWQLRRIRERVETSLEIGYPSVGELALLCGISQFHLMRCFKVSTGLQIHSYITEERIAAAKLMLREEQCSSSEIALRLGFRSSAYFSTAFRRTTGMTPSDFRRRARVNEIGGS